MPSIYKYEIAENFGYSSNTAEINAWNTDMWQQFQQNDWTKKSSVTSLLLDVDCQDLWRSHSENQMLKKYIAKCEETETRNNKTIITKLITRITWHKCIIS